MTLAIVIIPSLARFLTPRSERSEPEESETAELGLNQLEFVCMSKSDDFLGKLAVLDRNYDFALRELLEHTDADGFSHSFDYDGQTYFVAVSLVKDSFRTKLLKFLFL